MESVLDWFFRGIVKKKGLMVQGTEHCGAWMRWLSIYEAMEGRTDAGSSPFQWDTEVILGRDAEEYTIIYRQCGLCALGRQNRERFEEKVLRLFWDRRDSVILQKKYCILGLVGCFCFDIGDWLMMYGSTAYHGNLYWLTEGVAQIPAWRNALSMFVAFPAVLLYGIALFATAGFVKQERHKKIYHFGGSFFTAIVGRGIKRSIYAPALFILVLSTDFR